MSASVKTYINDLFLVLLFSRASAYEDTTRDSDKEETAASAASTIEAVEGRPQYLTANCVVYSFYNGDLTSAIQDHFDRALKRSRLEQNSASIAAGGNESPSHSDSTKLQSGKCRGCVDFLLDFFETHHFRFSCSYVTKEFSA